MRTIGVLFKSNQWKNSPFKISKVRKAYEELSKQGNVVYSSFKFLNKDTLKKAWKYDKKWILLKDTKIDVIFDRSRTTSENVKEKKKIKLKIINNPEFNLICWDKSKTYKLFSKFMPKSYLVNNKKQFEKILPKLSDKVVLKPKQGMKGNSILFKNKNKIKKIKENTIVQEFINSEEERAYDMRVILINGKIDHAYLRIAKKGCLLANCDKGAKKVFIKQVPKKVIKITKQVDKRLSKFKPRIYSIDFVFDKDNNPYILELESDTGFIYYKGKENLRKKFLKNVVRTFL